MVLSKKEILELVTICKCGTCITLGDKLVDDGYMVFRVKTDKCAEFEDALKRLGIVSYTKELPTEDGARFDRFNGKLYKYIFSTNIKPHVGRKMHHTIDDIIFGNLKDKGIANEKS